MVVEYHVFYLRHCYRMNERSLPQSHNERVSITGHRYRFDPTDKELIVDYLFNKVHGNPLPSTTVVKERDVYGDNRVWNGLFEVFEENTIYFFRRLKKKTEKGKIIDSVTDSSTWKMAIKWSALDPTSKINISFIPKEGVKGSYGTWVMNGYQLMKKMKKGKNGRISIDDDDADDDGRATKYGGSSDDVGFAMRESNFQTHYEHTEVVDSSSNNNLIQTISRGGKITSGYIACGDPQFWGGDEFQFGRDVAGMGFIIPAPSCPVPLKI
ncbi:hypothetical protein Dsin_021509 [Dipteronia sinensis]|uniref:NAC domain-containing protein n=1 Tax=Dipteronia sinensis TaxID=43782 RepID=A0AAD9ZZX0_9ROSI|nr:hypothetical protein Dsin_021509 [Dipteronia sinensis]